MKTNISTRPALIFIPDISGFTRFVSDVEIHHAQHIIEELLEVLIDANELGMEINEIEGDAILFYRFGPAPTAAELLAQIQRMFVRFHTHLKRYETHRICQCGACRTTNQLSLKVIAHFGEIAINNVKHYRKLFGKEVIVAHRLLKNGVEHREYVLITQQLLQACPKWVEIETAAWAPLQHTQEVYDSGRIAYCYLPLTPLHSQVPDLSPEDYSIPGVKVAVLKCSGLVQAPMELVFKVVADLSWRAKWIDGALPEVDHLNHRIFQNGSTHHCLANGPVIVSHNIESAEDTIRFTETDTGRTMCAVYTLRKLSSDKTMLEAEWFIRRHLLREFLFRLFVRHKLRRSVALSLQNLNRYCSNLGDQSAHPRLLLSSSAQYMPSTSEVQ